MQTHCQPKTIASARGTTLQVIRSLSAFAFWRSRSWLWLLLIHCVSIQSAMFPSVMFPSFSIQSAYGQDLQLLEEVRDSGTIRSIQSGMITVVNPAGTAIDCKIQDRDQRAVSIAGTAFRMPAKISVTGWMPAEFLKKGMIVSFQIATDEKGKPQADVSQIEFIPDDSIQLKIAFEKIERKKNDPLEQLPLNDTNADEATEQTNQQCSVTGRITSIRKNRLQLSVPKTESYQRTKFNVDLADNCRVAITDDSLGRVGPGDTVTQMIFRRLSSGDNVVTAIDIAIREDRVQTPATFEETLTQKFSHLPDELVPAREVRSTNFVLYTDLSERSSQTLLAKLESMHGLIGNYYGVRPRLPIECYVVSNFDNWENHKIHPTGVAKIREPAGVTISDPGRPGQPKKATVYSCDDHRVVQHEAVHAFCYQAFGETGPVWYAEGMAEMGNYWKPDDLAVDIDPVVINYLTDSSPKKLLEIVAAGQITGDSWQAYAWRWALCHLLASNPNYAQRFRQLGLNMMMGRKDSFENAYGSVAKNISFEYDQFIQHFGNGYRVDLCSWNWSVNPTRLSGAKRSKSNVLAQSGWQPTKLAAVEGEAYDYVCEGQWKIAKSEDGFSADGDSTGKGKLVGVVLHDFQLSEPFELGQTGSFVAPVSGQLYLRCRDDWTQLSDNEGEMTVHFRRSETDDE